MGYASRVPWRPRAGETRARQVEATPPEVRRAALAQETAAELLQDPIDLRQDTPPALRRVGIVGRVFPVLGAGGRDLHFSRDRPDLQRDAQVAQQRSVRAIEIR